MNGMADDDQARAVVREAIDAANAHDTGRFLDCFTAGGAVNDWGRVFSGHDRIKHWSDAEFIGKKVTLTDLAFVNDDDRVAVNARVGGDGFNGPSTFTFTVHGGKIELMRITA